MVVTLPPLNSGHGIQQTHISYRIFRTFELVTSKTDGAIVRSLEDNTTKFVSSRVHQFSHLESIEVYTNDENVNLADIFKAMDASTEPLPSEKDNKAVKSYFEKVFPSMDFERVYSSDMKKWFVGSMSSSNRTLKSSSPKWMRKKKATKVNILQKTNTMQYSADIQKLKHSFLPEHFSLTDWATLEPYFIQLRDREINSGQDLEQWLKDMSEMEAFISEDACWRQVRMTCDTENKTLEEAFNFFFMEIQPKIQPYADILNKKLVDCPFTKALDQEKYFTYLRSVKKSIDLFREANIPLQAEAAVLQQQYGSIAGKMMIEQDGQEFTLQQAGKFLESEDRNIRETVYKKIAERRLVDKDPLNELFSKLVALRHQVAINAGFSNYRDYKFAEMGRFDYTPASCFQFHEAVKKKSCPW